MANADTSFLTLVSMLGKVVNKLYIDWHIKAIWSSVLSIY
ncbi:hypothetical protein CZ794_12470 [Psychrobacter sp. JB385]|nr:hypothetical protein CZ794_12470 [Psychrobacter sp. JB385]